MNFTKFFSFLSTVTLLLLIAPFFPVFAQTAPTLGTAQSFAVLGGSAVTNTGPTIVNGDLGVSPGTSITGFPPGMVNGTIHDADAVAAQAQSDANTAYNFLAGQPCNTILTGQDLGGLTLTPGVYCFAAAAQLTGTLTLNAQGNPNAVFIFKIGSALTTASNSSVLLINSASACNVFFQNGSSATLGTGTQFMGNIFALASVTLTTNATLNGRAIGLNGAVTLDSNTVSAPACAVVPTTGFVQVCAVAGPGIPVGTNITFNVGGTLVTVAAGAGPAGTCSAPVQVPTGPVVITETIPGGDSVTGVVTSPNGSLVSSNLATGTATVNVTIGAQTTVTFTTAAIPPPPNGFVQVCKVAGAGIAAGTNFTFNVAGTPVTVAAGVAPGGNCATPVSLPAGAALVTETIPSGTLLAQVSTSPSPGLLVSSNLGTGTATVTVLSGGQTIVTFVDAAIPVIPTNGFVQVCKVAGAGVAVGTNFTFSVAGTPLTVSAGPAPGGSCGLPVTVPAGSAVITETIPAGTLVAGVSTLPSAGLVSSNLANGTATVTVNAGGQTIVTFIDAAIPVIPTNGFAQVCKVAGPGIPIGTIFIVTIGGTQVTVTAGPAPGGSCSTPVMVPSGPVMITEIAVPGVSVAGIGTSPGGLLVSSDLAAGTAIVTVNAGGQTIVTFIDAATVAPAAGFFLVNYLANLNVGDSFIDITNTGASSTQAFPVQNGNLCVNAYAFSPDEQLISCCSCFVTPDGLTSLSAKNDLVSNTLTPAVPTSIVVKLIASTAGTDATSCNPATVGTGTNLLASGLDAWRTTLHALPFTPGTPPTTFGATETPFLSSMLSAAELARITGLCGFIQTNGSGFGTCKTCRFGGLGAAHQ